MNKVLPPWCIADCCSHAAAHPLQPDQFPCVYGFSYACATVILYLAQAVPACGRRLPPVLYDCLQDTKAAAAACQQRAVPSTTNLFSLQ